MLLLPGSSITKAHMPFSWTLWNGRILNNAHNNFACWYTGAACLLAKYSSCLYGKWKPPLTLLLIRELLNNWLSGRELQLIKYCPWSFIASFSCQWNLYHSHMYRRHPTTSACRSTSSECDLLNSRNWWYKTGNLQKMCDPCSGNESLQRSVFIKYCVTVKE